MTATENPDDPSERHRYFRAIEDSFIDLRGSPLLLSPKDWQIAKEWYEQEVPLELVLRTVREVFARRETRRDEERHKKVWSLGYCKRSVEAVWRRQQELLAPGAEGEEQALDVPARLENLSAALPAGLPDHDEAAERIRALTGDAQVIEESLTEIDRELLQRAADALPEPDRQAIESELEASRAALVGRLPAAELERASEALREQILRRRLGLPVLSLFAPEAVGG